MVITIAGLLFLLLVLNDVVGTRGILTLYSVPIPSEAFNVTRGSAGTGITGWSRSYSTLESAENIVSYYQEVLSEQGWVIHEVKKSPSYTTPETTRYCIRAERFKVITAFIYVFQTFDYELQEPSDTTGVTISIPPAKSVCQKLF